jgi:type VI secretion system protein VasI
MTLGLTNPNRIVTFISLLAGSLLVATASQAETFTESIQECRTITSQGQRYQCYDDIEQETVESVTRDVGKFNYESTSDPITGQTVHSLSLRSDRGLNRRGNPIELKLTCESTSPNDYRLVLNWGEFLPSTSPEVTTRIGQGDSVTSTWSTDRFRERTIFSGTNSGFSKIELIDKLENEVAAGNATLVFRTTPYNYTPITAVFDMTGFVDVISPMRSSCQF